MPDIGLISQIYLGGVVLAFLTFIVMIGGGVIYSNLTPRQRLERAPVRQAEPTWALERKAA